MLIHATMIVASAILTLQGSFSLEDDGATLTLLEENNPVWDYHYAPVKAPRLVPARYERSCYFHPLYGLDGEIMTQDFPIDHLHHRGLFWAWPDSLIGDRKIDVWILKDARQRHLAWSEKKVDEEGASFAFVNSWAFDDQADDALVKEEVTLRVYPAEAQYRTMDFTLRFTNVSEEPLTFRGSETDNKGYGGFCFRPDATRKPFTFTAAQGVIDEDALSLDSPWVDISFPVVKGEEKRSGLAIFQHPELPGFPHSGWILRHYGFLGQSWPHTKDHVLEPGASFTLKYRVILHRGNCEEADIAALFQAYLTSCSSE